MATEAKPTISVRGAGVLGLWQALTLARAGYAVRVREAQSQAAHNAASHYAGAWLAPDCEAQSAPPIVRTLGHEVLAAWQHVYPGTQQRGTLVIAPQRDRGELEQFAQRSKGHVTVDAEQLASLEPDLVAIHDRALFFANEAHVAPAAALAHLAQAATNAGATITYDAAERDTAADITIDCRGLAAEDDLPDLRGVRGERVVVAHPDLIISRALYLLHPRQSVYVVPWGDGRYMAGATMVEREDGGAASVRSVLELLAALYAVHPAFAEATVETTGAGVRPAFPSNVPEIVVRDGGNTIFVNGAYRHGFLLAPSLASGVLGYVANRDRSHPLIRPE